MLSIPGQSWWSLEHDHLDGIAFGILFHHTADRELAEARAKAFALEVLGPLVGPATILESAIDAWLLADPRRPAPVWHPEPQVVHCAGCTTPITVAARHFAVVLVFGSLCDRCREVPTCS